MKIWIVVLFLGLGLFTQAQGVEYDGLKYEVKGDLIFKDGKDVTQTLSLETKNQIKTALDNRLRSEKVADEIREKQKDAEKSLKKAERAQKKAEKDQKKAEKAQKRVEKELKAQQKTQNNFQKASRRLEQNQTKYEKLKRKGKLSPNDDERWLNKLEKYRENLEDAKKKLNN